MSKRIVSFLLWLAKLIDEASGKVPVGNWSYSSGYISDFKPHLNKIARSLSRGWCSVNVRWNRDIKQAELYVPGGRILARVTVHGECSCPETAVVTPVNLSEKDEKIFHEAFAPHLRVRFEQQPA
ncbi:hypothetical protein ACFL6I_18265 [candidate division KSB1 bacterium]